MTQRKFRNAEERDAVCRQAASEAVRLGISMDSAPMIGLIEVFERYTSHDADHSGVYTGKIPADSIRGPGSFIEYILPARRIQKPMIRLTKPG